MNVFDQILNDHARAILATAKPLDDTKAAAVKLVELLGDHLGRNPDGSATIAAAALPEVLRAIDHLEACVLYDAARA